MIFNVIKSVAKSNCRTFKNFGHGRQRVPTVTVLWHGFLTFTFIGCAIEWKKLAQLIFGDKHKVEEAPWEHTFNIPELPQPTGQQEENKT